MLFETRLNVHARIVVNPLNTGAGQAFRMYSEEQNDYYERKLKHYNVWLMEKYMKGKANDS